MATQIATIPSERRSVLVSMADRYGMEPAAFEQTLRATVVPKDCTKEQFAAFLLVAKEYNLNPITKEIFAFPNRGGGIQPIVSVDGWSNLINSHPQCDGFEFEDALDSNSNLTSITCKIYRKDRSHPVVATEYMEECARDTSTWKQWPRRMLRHKALIQAARYAFGFAGIVDPDEAERGHYADVPGGRLVPPPAPPPSPPKAETLPGDWQDYLDRQKSELGSAQSPADHQAIHDTVKDAIAGAVERSEISAAQADDIKGAWEAMAE